MAQPKSRPKEAADATPNGSKKKGGSDKIKDEKGRYKPGVHVWCLYAGDKSYRDCEIIEVNTLKSGEIRYYLHWVEFNRRMDTWVKADQVFEMNPDDPEAKLSSGRQDAVDMLKKRKRNTVEFVEEEYGEDNGMDEASIREHEEVTKVKNVNTLELGRHLIDTWYFSPIPKE
eukprot:CAMPEP_0184015658 /NCGR_PEP_ID=MMETSP0954-20121128/6447_1 /TAXON_ID=627963 /ORGANISM="Aplanochytrium sp, Strain PBS07" /LENGTH=171 /DNA_ID=CAMNT_0026296495 /DNA_START=105 /DNA_END=617 /DNA_ORIENTATION=+